MHIWRTTILLVLCAALSGCGSASEAARLALVQSEDAVTEEHFFQRVRMGDTAAAALFLNAGVNPNTADEHGVTVMMLMAAAGDLEGVKRLLNAGANPQVRNEAGWTALTYAERNGWSDVVALLKKAGAGGSQEEFRAELQRQGVFYNPEGFMAVAKTRPELILTYVGAGADPNARDEKGVTPLMLAAAADRTEVVRGLISLGVDINATDDSGWTALTYARTSGAQRSAELLIQAGAVGDGNVPQERQGGRTLKGESEPEPVPN